MIEGNEVYFWKRWRRHPSKMNRDDKSDAEFNVKYGFADEIDDQPLIMVCSDNFSAGRL